MATGPITGLVRAANALAYQNRRQAVIANNLANANSVAFKADRVAAHGTESPDRTEPFAKLDLSQGTLRDTGRPLDLALEGEGFLVVRTPNGDRLTRGGSLQIDTQQRLVDDGGDPIMDVNGRPIVIEGLEVTIEDDGRVLVDGAMAGQLSLATAAKDTYVRKEGNLRFAVDGAIVPARADAVRVRQGRLEDANVDTMTGMVDMIAIQRMYAMNVQALTGLDGTLATITNQVGRVQ